MGVKILWQAEYRSASGERGGLKEATDTVVDLAKRVARPDTTIELRYNENGPESVTSHLLFHRQVTLMQVVGKIAEAEADFDAAFPGICAIDGWSQAARQICSIPVIGASESSMMTCMLMGRRFAYIVPNPVYITPFEDKIYECGWERRAITNPIRSLEAPTAWNSIADSAMTGSTQWVEMFDKLAQECCRDGADAVICGCNPGAAQLAAHDYFEVSNYHVPVILPPATMVKFAEMMVDLRRTIGLEKSHKTTGMYRPFDDASKAELMAMVSKMVHFGEE